LICENCGVEHTGEYGSGRFCSSKCARGFSTKSKRKAINEKVGQKLSSRKRWVEITCVSCKRKVKLPYQRRHQLAYSRSCSSTYTNSQPETKEKLRQARLKEISKGNIGYGIKCEYRGIRCDSALEYAFLKWYWQKNPNALIKRFKGCLEGDGFKYQPDFIVDDKIIVEVKYDTAYIGDRLNEKWQGYVERQAAKKELLRTSGYEYLWITNETLGNNFYREAIKEAKQKTCKTNQDVIE